MQSIHEILPASDPEPVLAFGRAAFPGRDGVSLSLSRLWAASVHVCHARTGQVTLEGLLESADLKRIGAAYGDAGLEGAAREAVSAYLERLDGFEPAKTRQGPIVLNRHLDFEGFVRYVAKGGKPRPPWAWALSPFPFSSEAVSRMDPPAREGHLRQEAWIEVACDDLERSARLWRFYREYEASYIAVTTDEIVEAVASDGPWRDLVRARIAELSRLDDVPRHLHRILRRNPVDWRAMHEAFPILSTLPEGWTPEEPGEFEACLEALRALHPLTGKIPSSLSNLMEVLPPSWHGLLHLLRTYDLGLGGLAPMPKPGWSASMLGEPRTEIGKAASRAVRQAAAAASAYSFLAQKPGSTERMLRSWTLEQVLDLGARTHAGAAPMTGTAKSANIAFGTRFPDAFPYHAPHHPVVLFSTMRDSSSLLETLESMSTEPGAVPNAVLGRLPELVSGELTAVAVLGPQRVEGVILLAHSRGRASPPGVSATKRVDYLDRTVYLQDFVTSDGSPPSAPLWDLTKGWLRALADEMPEKAWIEPFPVKAMRGTENERATALKSWHAFLPRGSLEDA